MPTETAVRAAPCQLCAVRSQCALGRIPARERQIIEPWIREQIFRPGDVLTREGDRSGVVRFVKIGTVFGYRLGLDGESRPIGVVRRGSALGVFGIFDQPNPATCTAVSTVRACELPMVALRASTTCQPQLLAHATQSMADNFAMAAAWSEAMRLPGAINRLAYVLLLLAEAHKPSPVELPSHSKMAELLATRRETVARALRTLENEGGLRRLTPRRCEVSRGRLLALLSRGTT
jgi:CRP-like cAMP-binding protein